jgi:hypothetical protein
MALTVFNSQKTLIRALEGIRVTYPEVWEMLTQGCREMLEPEAKAVIRAAPDRLQVAQGRAQIAEDILGLLHNCAFLAEEMRKQQAAVNATRYPPQFS